MAVTRDSGFPVSVRDTTGSATDITWPTFTTPGTNRMAVAMFLGNGTTTTSIASMTSPNLTWTHAVSVVDAAVNDRVEIWTAWAASVVTTEQINTTFSGSPNYNRQSAVIWSLDGTDSSGVGNSATTIASVTTVSVTATAADSLILAGLVYRSAGGDIGVDANSTSEYNGGGGGGFGFNERACSRATTGAGATVLGFTSAELFAAYCMAGLEIKATGGGGATFDPPAPLWSYRSSIIRR